MQVKITNGQVAIFPYSVGQFTYRQALRDVPSQAGFPWNVSWPAQP